MEPLKISVGVRVSPGMLRLALVGGLLGLTAIDISSESVTLSTYFPAPSGVYASLIATTGARLGRDGGTVAIGSSATAGSRLAVMNGNFGIGSSSATAKLSFNDLNDGGNLADGITWYTPSPTSYGLHRTAGAWAGPNYQQLRAGWDTGVVIDGGTAYGMSGTVLQPNAGNVGIGVVAPTYKLHVNGTVVARGCGVGPGDPAPAITTYAIGQVNCPGGTYATWLTGVIAKYQNSADTALNGQMFCCPCVGACPSL